MRGFAGFGTALTIVPSLSLLFGPQVAVPVMVVVDSVATLPIVVRSFSTCRWRDVLPLTLSYAAVAPIGVIILVIADPSVLTAVMGGVVLLATAVLATGWQYRGRAQLPVTLATGATSGLLGGSVGISGPPVIIFWLAAQNSAQQVRANLFAYFGCITVVSFATLGTAGLFTGDVLVLSAILTPAFAVGLFVGQRLFRLASERVFRAIALAIVGTIGCVAFVGAIA